MIYLWYCNSITSMCRWSLIFSIATASFCMTCWRGIVKSFTSFLHFRWVPRTSGSGNSSMEQTSSISVQEYVLLRGKKTGMYLFRSCVGFALMAESGQSAWGHWIPVCHLPLHCFKRKYDYSNTSKRRKKKYFSAKNYKRWLNINNREPLVLSWKFRKLSTALCSLYVS